MRLGFRVWGVMGLGFRGLRFGVYRDLKRIPSSISTYTILMMMRLPGAG